jgi:diguanylate cyclase (GGDEF)-like protein
VTNRLALWVDIDTRSKGTMLRGRTDDGVSATKNDDATNWRLWLLVGLVVVSGAVVLGWSTYKIFLAPDTGWYPWALLALSAVANSSGFRVRFRATSHQFSVMSAAVLVATVLEPIWWVTACAAGGVLISNLIGRPSAEKIAFNVAKEALAAAAASGATLIVLGTTPAIPQSLTDGFAQRVIALIAGAVVYAVVDDSLFFPVVSLASGTPLRQRLVTHWDIRYLSRVGAFVVAVVMAAVVSADQRILLVMPPLLWALHLLMAGRVRGREEREAWQQLARATDELNGVDLDRVLETAVRRAAELFSANEVEVEGDETSVIRQRLVRGDAERVYFDGLPDAAPPTTGQQLAIPLEGHDGFPRIGELRLRFQGRVQLSEREGYTFRTFAGALCTAIRNASAHAETRRLAESHALAAAQDPLTKLANRRRLEQYATEILDGPAHGVTALMLLDLNRFKEINDTLGHSAGDKVLIEIARRLEATATPGDLVTRFGGDEFAILLTELPAPPVATPRAQAVLASIAAPMDLDGMRISVEASAGIAVADGIADIAELLRRADVAMYQAKRSGQQVTRYAATRDTADVDSLVLGGDLARALAEEEFTVEFQPIVDLGTAEVIAAEALARWSHPDHGDLPPARFLDAIERSTQLGAFAESVLNQALTAAVTWRAAGYNIPVAVNVSPRSLLDPRFPDSIKASLDRHGLPPEALVIEVTESLMLSQLEVVDEVLGALRDAGILLALDDFGTGYSSLSTLARVPVQELKIDRGFVSGMDSQAEAAVVRSTVELGRSLQVMVVAEGVESEDQRRRLWELGCPAGQGYLFARAMPLDALLAALGRGFGGRPGRLAEPLHEAGEVVRIPKRSRNGNQRLDRSS